MKTFQKGDDVYSVNGHKAMYVADVGGEYIVQPYWQADDGEEVLDDPQSWTQVFESAPTAILEERIAVLAAQEKAIQESIFKARKDEREAVRSSEATIKSLAKYEPLKNIQALIDGKLTHVVTVAKYARSEMLIRVLEIAETVCDNDTSEESINGKWQRPLRFIGLNGSFKSDHLEWRMSGYSSPQRDGDSQLVYPFTSREDAVSKAIQLFQPFIDKRGELFDSQLEYYVTTCKHLGLEVHPDITQRIREARLKVIRESVEKERATLSKSEAKLAEMESQE